MKINIDKRYPEQRMDRPVEYKRLEQQRKILERILCRFIEDLPNLEKRINKNKIDAELIVNNFAERYFDFTFHPSQSKSDLFRIAFEQALQEIHDFYKNLTTEEQNEFIASPFEISEKASKYAQKIFAESASKLLDINDATIPSNATLEPATIRLLQGKIKIISQENLVNIKQQIESLYSLFKIQPHFYDETFETVADAKKILLNNILENYYVWIDFDGTKRAEGHAYSKYGALVFEDIKSSQNYLDSNQKNRADELYNLFQKNAALNHTLTLLLKEDNLDNKDNLEEIMNTLKKERENLLLKLVQIKNLIKRNREKEKETAIIYLSDEVKFIFRLDYRTIIAAKNKQYNDNQLDPKKHKPCDERQCQMLRNILNQVLELNKLECENKYKDKKKNIPLITTPKEQIIYQIMIAQAQSAQDVQILEKEFEELRCTKARESEGDYSSEVSFVPLFEEEHTLNPEKISKFLKEMWDYYGKIFGKKQSEMFNKRIKEIFIAGSDSSKMLGQTKALIQAQKAIIAVEQFNKEHNTDVRIKFGTGEAGFRQGGFFDLEGYLPLIRGKIFEYTKELENNPKLLEEKYGENYNQIIQEIEQMQQFLIEKFGADWQKILIRKPRGYNRLLKLFPGFNVVTVQSATREFLIFMDPSRILRMVEEIKKGHDKYFKNPDRLNNIQLLEEWWEKAGENESQFYQKMMLGEKNDEEKSFLGRLLQFLTTGLPQIILRDRPLKREQSNKEDNYIHDLNELAKKEINSRAIAINMVSGFTFPLFLLGKGSMLEKARGSNTLEKILPYLDVKEILRQMKLFDTIAKDVFQIMENTGMVEVAKDLKQEWQRLINFLPQLQNEMWRQELPDNYDITKLTPEEKQKLAQCFVPGTRELLIHNFNSESDQGFESEYTKLFRENFQKHKRFLEIAVDYIQKGYNFREILYKEIQNKKKINPNQLESKIQKKILENLTNPAIANPLELSRAYVNFQKSIKNFIFTEQDKKNYGEFIATLVHCYGTGM